MSTLGSGAMRVDEGAEEVVLRASDWTSPPSPDDLVVRLRIDE